MALIYRFKKEKIENVGYVSRPKIPIILTGKTTSIETIALLDTGCDTTVIPEGLAKAVGLDMSGEKTKLYAYRESADVIESKAQIALLGKMHRDTAILNVPVLIALAKTEEEESDIVLGVNGVFDHFDVTFQKSKNKIIFKKIN